MADLVLMAPNRLSLRTWLRAVVLAELLASEEFTPDLALAVSEAEEIILGSGSQKTDRVYARAMAWRQTRREGVRLAFVQVERMARLTDLILGEPANDETD